MNKPLILVVEDDVAVRNLITTTLRAHDYRFLTAANGESAASALGRICPLLSSVPEVKIQTRSAHWTPARTII